MKLVICPCAYGNVIAVPTLVVDHPANTYPDLVGAVGAAEIEPPVTVVVPDTALPDWESQVTFKVFPPHTG